MDSLVAEVLVFSVLGFALVTLTWSQWRRAVAAEHERDLARREADAARECLADAIDEADGLRDALTVARERQAAYVAELGSLRAACATALSDARKLITGDILDLRELRTVLDVLAIHTQPPVATTDDGRCEYCPSDGGACPVCGRRAA